MLDIRQIQAFIDNYIYAALEPESGFVAIVDPADAAPVIAALERWGWTPTHILSTHHHADHVGGNLELKERYGLIIVGPKADARRIPGIDVTVGDGERYPFGAEEAEVFDVPGHTRGHIAYWFARSKALFCGDTLFALGCGRLFEGTPEQMWSSLKKLRALPGETRVYCAHEYTENNARFALTVEPENAALRRRAERVRALRAKGEPTVPSLLSEEIETNPFLRADASEALRARLKLRSAPPVDVFAEVRRRKDRF